MDPIKLGCMSCGKPMEITPPDPKYTEPARKYKKDALDDMLNTHYDCDYCNGTNYFYWYKPDNLY